MNDSLPSESDPTVHDGRPSFDHWRCSKILRFTCRKKGVSTAFSRSGGRVAVTAVLSAWLVLATSLASAQDQYYDLTASSDRRANFAYIDELKAQPGGDALSEQPRDYLVHLVERMGHIDRFHVRAGDLAAHIRMTKEVESRFYPEAPLTGEEIKRYLLPLRLRYESTAQIGWKPFLRERLAGETIGVDSARAMATRIFAWVGSGFELIDLGPTYRLPLRGDLDPITVVRGGRGNEIDLSILAVAALRMEGVAARLVWVPVLRDAEGGKVWVEFLSDDREWLPWVPRFQFHEELPWVEHRRRIIDSLSPAVPVVLTHLEAPESITSSYFDCGTVHVIPLSGDPEFQTSFLVRSGSELFPLYGYDWKYPDGPNTLKVTAGPLWVTAGYRTTRVVLKKIDVERDCPIWVGVNTREGTIVVERSRERPAGFQNLGD